MQQEKGPPAPCVAVVRHREARGGPGAWNNGLPAGDPNARAISISHSFSSIQKKAAKKDVTRERLDLVRRGAVKVFSCFSVAFGGSARVEIGRLPPRGPIAARNGKRAFSKEKTACTQNASNYLKPPSYRRDDSRRVLHHSPPCAVSCAWPSCGNSAGPNRTPVPSRPSPRPDRRYGTHRKPVFPRKPETPASGSAGARTFPDRRATRFPLCVRSQIASTAH